MCKCRLQLGNTAIDFEASAQHNLSPRAVDFIGCLIEAAMANLPGILQSFMECIAGGGNPPGGGFTPGQRRRCGS